MASSDDELHLTEVAEQAGVHYMTAYRYVRTGVLPARQQDGRWLVRRADLEAMTATQQRPAGRGVRSRHQSIDRLVARLKQGDEPGSALVVDQALAGGASPAEVYVEVLGPALRVIGAQWAAGAVSVGEEHRATAVATRLIGRLGPRFTRRGVRRGTVVVGVAPGDHHALPAAMLADVFRSAGYTVVELGGSTPLESFLAAAAEPANLVAVCISVAVDGQLPATAEVVAALRAAVPQALLLVGGPAVIDRDTARSIGADDWAPDAIRAAALVESATSSAP